MQEVLRRLVIFFRRTVELLSGAYQHLNDPRLGVTDFSDSKLKPIFAHLRSHLGSSLLPTTQSSVIVQDGTEAWKVQCARLLLQPSQSVSRYEEDVKRAVIVYSMAMKSTTP